jgi:hypothetical protein
MTVLGVLSAGPARRVHLAFTDGAEANAPLKPLRPTAAGVAGRRGLRYAVLAVPGAHCVEQMVTRGAAGGILWDGAPEGHSCSE